MIGRRSLSTALSLVASFAVLLPATAGAWTFAYGPTETLDQAQRRVAPVRSCNGGGYVAVGTKGLGGAADPDVYVVRTDNSGATLWEFWYNVDSGSRRHNEGVAIAELPRGEGFVILSNNLGGGVWYPALTRIDCWGLTRWTRKYPAFDNRDLLGKDLIVTESGDLAVAGVYAHGEDEDAWMMRTDAVGNVIWDNYYRILGGQQAFHALTEAARLQNQREGDLVAVGRYKQSGDTRTRGFVARVRGINGDHGIPPGCLASHGFADLDGVFNSVVQLRGPEFAGQFAFAGTVTDRDGHSDMWAVRADPCTILSESRIGDGNVYASEEAYDLREVLVPSAGIPAGSLAIAGLASPPSAFVDAALVFVSPGAPMGYIAGWRFGDSVSHDPAYATEVFHSLAEIPAVGLQEKGFILAGYTEFDWGGTGDPRDLFLVHFDPEEPSCSTSWAPWVTESDSYPAGHGARLRQPTSPSEAGTATTSKRTGLEICPLPTPPEPGVRR